MQFSIISIVAALAATTSASYVPTNGTATSAPYPTGTAAPSFTGTMPTSSTLPFTGGASHMAGSALGLVIAGGIALFFPSHDTTAPMTKPQDNLLKGEPLYDSYPSSKTDTNSDSDDAPLPPSRNASAYNPLHDFVLPPGSERQYSQQFADMYFLRLMQLKKVVKEKAEELWHNFELGGQKANFVERVLDVRQGELCWVVGTVFMEMAQKPNVLDDIGKDHWIADPPHRDTYISPGGDEMMLEDESGRLRVTGKPLNRHFVTGCIIAALGTEEADGTFKIIATQCADLPRQPQRWERDDIALAKQKESTPQRKPAGKLAIVSGLELSGDSDHDISQDLLLEYLTGEVADSSTQADASKITRLLIAGGSLRKGRPILSRDEFAAKKSAARSYGYDASLYNAAPTQRLDEFLCEIIPTLPITLLPGASDPANVALPQQRLHAALLPNARIYAEPPVTGDATLAGLDAVTNPWLGDIDGYRVLGTGGQTVEDLLKYLDHINSVDAMEMMLRWRCVAPTAPDTLWCYPFQDQDPLMLTECPHIYIAGCQKKFDKKLIEGPAGQKVLLVSVPKFSTTGKLVLIDMESWEVEVIKLKASRDKMAKERQENGDTKMEE
ncbi:dna polymerase subunit delta-2 [Curvularia clavata]|uniref:DNA-directed DNA polymerase n=1 Tax=Curvularia clavata TaxID=95742 RepID=A0A9Q9DQQ4_CURCL|nr:dna polymerase subunit delta-2 [Curvularia clavata]